MQNKLTLGRGDRAFYITTVILLIIIVLLIAYPLYFIIVASLSEYRYVLTGEIVLWPKGFNTDSYKRVLETPRVVAGFKNTVYYTSVGTCVNVLLTMMGGYALSINFHGRRIAMFFIVFTMFFSGGMIPTYFVVKNLGLLDSFWAMILPGAVSAWNLIIARTFLSSNIPAELYEAAEMDGCSRIWFFISVVMPLSGVLISILAVFYAMGHWNSYFNALIYLINRERYPLQLVLREILIQNSVPVELRSTGATDMEMLKYLSQIRELMKYALIVISSVPMIIVYLFFQKNFVKGVLIGSLKG